MKRRVVDAGRQLMHFPGYEYSKRVKNGGSFTGKLSMKDTSEKFNKPASTVKGTELIFILYRLSRMAP
ncbi:MAG: hypothetical protein Q8930_12000 [Bacillota bacterium]|nr:hypothetical protein [Bacillota bacterium]